MPRNVIAGLVLAAIAGTGFAAERKFDFAQFPVGQAPAGFKSVVAGAGKPGDWKVILEEVAPKLAPLSDKAPVVSKQAVLAQLSQDDSDSHFPILLFEDEKFDDFTFTARLKTVGGGHERMAGVVFRFQDEKNFYVARISSLDNTFRFYKVVNGEIANLIGPKLPLPTGEWHEITVECSGNHIKVLLDHQEPIPMLTDSSFAKGKVGFWTKSDSVSYFADAHITYKPIEVPAQVIVRQALKKYPRLLGLKIVVKSADQNATRLVGSKEPSECGQAGNKADFEVISKSQIMYGKDTSSVTVTMPLRDRNGDTMAAVRVTMNSFKGQTEQNAVARAMPVVKEIQSQVQSLQDLIED
jgi:hypothetical protein